MKVSFYQICFFTCSNQSEHWKKISNNNKNNNNDTIESMKHNVTKMHENDYYIYNFDKYLNIENIKI